jgi:hypothetical protein
VVDAHLEGIVAKRLIDAYHPKLARWHKVLDAAFGRNARSLAATLYSGSPSRCCYGWLQAVRARLEC